jgi:hypothetical protein
MSTESFGAGYAAYKSASSSWQNAPFLPTTPENRKTGNIEVWGAQRLAAKKFHFKYCGGSATRA